MKPRPPPGPPPRLRGRSRSAGRSRAGSPGWEPPLQHLLKQGSVVAPGLVVAPTTGPRATLKAFCATLPSAGVRSEWLQEAYLKALLGSCPKSLNSVRSGIRCWLAFAAAALGQSGGEAMPPTAQGLVAWSMQFRCVGTFSNYLSYVRFGALLAGVPTDAFVHEAVKRAKTAVAKRMLFEPRPHHFIGLVLLERLVNLADQRPATRSFKYLWIIAYAFLLRVPSEALPLQAGDIASRGGPPGGLFLRSEDIFLRL